MKENFKYSDNDTAKVILRNEKIFNIMYIIFFIILSLLYLFFIISGNLEISILYLIIVILMAIGKNYRSKKIMAKYMYKDICFEGIININLYNLTNGLKTQKSHNTYLNNMALAYLELGEFEKAETIFEHLEKANLNNNQKIVVLKNNLKLLFLKQDLKKFAQKKEKLLELLDSTSENMISVNIQEFALKGDYENVDKLCKSLEKKNMSIYNQVSYAYYRGYALEKNKNKDYEKYYKFVGENGKNLFIAKDARHKLKIADSNETNEIKSHLGIKLIIFITLIIVTFIIFVFCQYNYESKNIKWDTGVIQLTNKEIQLPCSIENFEKILGIEINKSDIKNNFYSLNNDLPNINNSVSLYLNNNMVMGIVVNAINFDDNTKYDINNSIVFPNEVTINNSTSQVRKIYNTGILNFFNKIYSETLNDEGRNSYSISYNGKKYNMSIQTVNDRIKEIFYYYKQV